MNKSSGFSLIELMVVMAVVAMLAVIAVPYYADHTQRTKVSGALAGIAGVRTATALCIQERGQYNGCNSGDYNIPAAIASGDAGTLVSYVDALTVADGVIQLTTTGTNSAGQMLALTLTPTSANSTAIRWEMTGSGCASSTPVLILFPPTFFLPFSR